MTGSKSWKLMRVCIHTKSGMFWQWESGQSALCARYPQSAWIPLHVGMPFQLCNIWLRITSINGNLTVTANILHDFVKVIWKRKHLLVMAWLAWSLHLNPIELVSARWKAAQSQLTLGKRQGTPQTAHLIETRYELLHLCPIWEFVS